jgi:hypothetical protein
VRVTRASDTVAVAALRLPRRWCTWARWGCCRRRPDDKEAADVTVTAVRGVGLSVVGGAHDGAFVPADRLGALFVHEGFAGCDVVAGLAVHAVGGDERLLLPFGARADVSVAQLGAAVRELAGALDVGTGREDALLTHTRPREEDSTPAAKPRLRK